ncbi:MAG: hypothetical protein DHS20C10_01640 [marine bacterium B5-7]|nr:MAG: hypothetical protein DHS20C10_01640 [marine bacterium B5-7]
MIKDLTELCLAAVREIQEFVKKNPDRASSGRLSGYFDEHKLDTNNAKKMLAHCQEEFSITQKKFSLGGRTAQQEMFYIAATQFNPEDTGSYALLHWSKIASVFSSFNSTGLAECVLSTFNLKMKSFHDSSQDSEYMHPLVVSGLLLSLYIKKKDENKDDIAADDQWFYQKLIQKQFGEPKEDETRAVFSAIYESAKNPLHKNPCTTLFRAVYLGDILQYVPMETAMPPKPQVFQAR